MNLPQLLELPQPLSDEHQSMLHKLFVENMAEIGRLLIKLGSNVRTKPLMGGVFGHGRFLLSSHAYVSNGLDKVDYLVLEARTWLVLGTGRTQPEALDQARKALSYVSPLFLAQFLEQLVLKRAEQKAQEEAEAKEARDRWFAERQSTVVPIAKQIPKRRRQIFEKSDGKCHYCSTALTLDGRWHIEHKMPKALFGTNERSNLVASCAPCNFKKRDKTDTEFIEQRAI